MWRSEPACQKPNNFKKLKHSADVRKHTKNQNDRKSLNVERLHLTEEKGGLYTSIRMTLFCSRVLGLLPLSGLTCQTSDRLRFNLRSPYSIYFGVSLFGQFLMALTSCFYLIQHGFSLPNITNTIFNTSSLLSSLALVHMGRCWPLFMKRIEEMEKKLPPFRNSLRNTTANITMFILIVAAVEHILSVFYGCTVAYTCDSTNAAETYFKYSLPWIFEYTTYSTWKGVVAEIFIIQSTFIWSYNDLVMMLIGIYLAEHFIIHNELLKNAVQKDRFVCSEFRTQYLKIVHIVKLVNDQFGIYLLTSISGSLYWICTQLFYVLNKGQTGHYVINCKLKDYVDSKSLHSLHHSVYFVYSFSYLGIRALLVLLLAARVHSNASVPVTILNKLPSSKYNIEVQRYLSQIKNMKIAMSGLDFFYVTRTMILTLIGKIVTYELVLLQFNKYNK